MSAKRTVVTSLLTLIVSGSVSAEQPTRFVYVANQQSGDVSAFAADPLTGLLTSVPGSPFPAGSGPAWVAVHPTGKFVYVANEGTNDISAFSADPTTGALFAISGSPFPSTQRPFSITTDASGKYAFVASRGFPGSGGVSVYKVNHSTGALTLLTPSPVLAGSHPTQVTVHHNGKFLYVANFYSNNISAFAIDASGGLTPISGSPFPADNGPQSFAIDHNGKLAYAANNISNTISVYALDATTGVLTSAPSVSSNGTPSLVAADPRGEFLFAANDVNPGFVSVSKVNPSTGQLTAVSASPFPAASSTYSLAPDTTGQFLYAANIGANNVFAYVVERLGGLVQLGNSVFSTGGSPISIAVSPGPSQ